MPRVAEAPKTQIIHNGPAEVVVKDDGTVLLKNVPGGIPGEEGLILVRPVPGREEGEIYETSHLGQSYWRSWGKIRVLKGSKRFPAGVEIGVVYEHTDTGTGIPFAERGVWQIGEDGYGRLAAYANDDPYLSMTERRKYARDTEKFLAEKGAGAQRHDTTTPSEALTSIGQDRMKADIQRMIDEGVKAALAKQAGTK